MLNMASIPVQLMAPAQAGLIAGDPVKNARALLRNALPVDNKPVRKMQVRAFVQESSCLSKLRTLQLSCTSPEYSKSVVFYSE